MIWALILAILGTFIEDNFMISIFFRALGVFLTWKSSSYINLVLWKKDISKTEYYTLKHKVIFNKST
jgi:hypothetical protein